MCFGGVCCVHTTGNKHIPPYLIQKFTFIWFLLPVGYVWTCYRNHFTWPVISDIKQQGQLKIKMVSFKVESES